MQHVVTAAPTDGMSAGIQPQPRRLDTDQAHRLVFDVRMENADGVAVAPDAVMTKIRVLLRDTQAFEQRWRLDQALLADHSLEVPHHGRVRVHAGYRTNQIEGGPRS